MHDDGCVIFTRMVSLVEAAVLTKKSVSYLGEACRSGQIPCAVYEEAFLIPEVVLYHMFGVEKFMCHPNVVLSSASEELDLEIRMSLN